MSDVKDRIKLDYLSGVPPKKLAEKYDTSINTIKSWIKRYGWSKMKKQSAPSRDEGAPQKRTQRAQKKAVAEDVDHVMENPDLTDKQRLFCLHYVRCFNAVKAYRKAFSCSYENACGHAHELLKNVEIKNEIHRLKQSRLNREMLDEHDIFQKYMDIAFADITDYVEFGREEIQVMGAFGPVEVKDPETGERVTLKKTVNTVRFKESDQVDGTIIAEVKQGKDGASVKLMDRMKALNWLAEHMDLATDTQKAQIEQMKANTERLRRDSSPEDDEGVEIINDVEKEETDKDIGTDNPEVSAPVQ